jgi:hypothetical protein
MKRLTQFGWRVLASLYAAPALAANSIAAPQPPVAGRAITLDNIIDVAGNLIDVFISLAAIIMMGGIIVTGIQMILSRGDEKKFGDAKRQLKYVIIGSFVILAVGIILNTIAAFAKDPLRTFGL